MTRQLDKITFESRRELSELISVLDTYLQEHPKADNRQTAEVLRDQLEVMYMEW